MEKKNNNHKKDSAQKHGAKRQQSKRKKPDTAVVASTNTRRGEVYRAARRNSDTVNKIATQHVIDVPVNKSVYNGSSGHQFTTGDMKRANKLPIASKTLKVIPLGGLGGITIGNNMMALEYGNDIIVIDMGMLFPGDDYPGINYMVPSIEYLEARKHKIRGHIFTHGHLDHIGGAKHILKKLPAPVYGSKFTIGMVERQMSEDPSGYKPDYNVLNQATHERVQLGDSFSIELLQVNHSIPDSTAVIVRTPAGIVMNTGDWRFEEDPIDGKKFDIPRLQEIADKEGVLLLMSDVTSCEVKASDMVYGEPEIADTFDVVIGRATGRVVVSTFSSQIHRIQSVLNIAKKHNRKVAFAGYSMLQNMEVALRTGVITIPKDTVMRMDDIIKLADNKIIIIATGSQGEINAVLARMATGSHRHMKVKPTDTIIFSSNPIPGNEKNVVRTVDGLMREGSKIIENRTREIEGCGPLHKGGHAPYEDHIKLLEIVKPKFFVPIHGEFHMLVHGAELAVKETSMPKENVFVLDSGDVLELTADSAVKTGRVKVGSIMVDQSGSEVSDVVLKDRIHMSTEGIFTVILAIDKKSGRLATSPDIISRGFIYLKDSEKLMGKIRQYLKQKTTKAYGKGSPVDLDNFKKEIREDVAHILFDETQHTPIVIPVINVLGDSPRPPKHDSFKTTA